MRRIFKRVVEFDGVSSSRKAKIFSLVFLLAAGYISLPGAIRGSAASDITVQKIIELTNASREEKGESSLAANGKLAGAATEKAEDMIAKNYFSHTSPEGTTPWHWIEETNYEYNFAGENLAMDFHTAEKMQETWMASPTHRANILNEKYKEIGAAVKTGLLNGHQTVLVVVMFGSGDKNISIAADADGEIPRTGGREKPENGFPALPAAGIRATAAKFQNPVITSPQAGEASASEKTRITGRAKPASVVKIFDSEDLVASAIADGNGWFFSQDVSLSEGDHRLSAQTENGSRSGETEFFIDRKKPDVRYRLFADENNPSRFLVRTSANKEVCRVEFNGEARTTAPGETAIFSVERDKSSVVLKVSDRAGNKNFRLVNLANYHLASGKNYFSRMPSALFLPSKKMFAAESGREAVRNNLGIAMGGLNKY